MNPSIVELIAIGDALHQKDFPPVSTGHRDQNPDVRIAGKQIKSFLCQFLHGWQLFLPLQVGATLDLTHLNAE